MKSIFIWVIGTVFGVLYTQAFSFAFALLPDEKNEETLSHDIFIGNVFQENTLSKKEEGILKSDFSQILPTEEVQKNTANTLKNTEENIFGAEEHRVGNTSVQEAVLLGKEKKEAIEKIGNHISREKVSETGDAWNEPYKKFSKEVVYNQGETGEEIEIDSFEEEVSGTPKEVSEKDQKTEGIESIALGYEDRDADGYIDTIFLEYPETLTGEILTGNILLFSATGGLYEEYVPTLSGYVLSGAIEDTLLVLFIRPATIQKDLLAIDATPKSELRLKTKGDIGISTLSGKKLAPILLGNSFEKYKNILHPSNDDEEDTGEDDTGEEDTGEEDTGEEDTGTGTEDTGTGTEDTGTGTEDTGTGTEDISEELFPKIFPTLQRVSDGSFQGDTFLCTRIPCRINLDFSPIFQPPYTPSEYQCTFSFREKIFSGCNPPQWTFSSEDSFVLELLHTPSGKIFEKTFFVTLPPPSDTEEHTFPDDTYTFPSAFIDLYGKKAAFLSYESSNKILCHKKICTLTLSGKKSTGQKLSFAWYLDNQYQGSQNILKLTSLSQGEYSIVLRVRDSFGEYDETVLFFQVISPQETKKVSIQKRTPKNTGQKKSPSLEKKEPFLFKKPTIQVQDSPFIQQTEDGAYTCTTSRKSCRIQLHLSGVQKEVAYHWNFSGQTHITSRPAFPAFPLGEHTVILEAFEKVSGGLLWKTTIPITVESVALVSASNIKNIKKAIKKAATKIKNTPVKQKKIATSKDKKPVQKKQKSTTLSKNTDVPTFLASLGEQKFPPNESLLYISLLSLLLGTFFFARLGKIPEPPDKSGEKVG